MGLEEEYQLSCYEELTEIGQNPKVHLVKEITTGDIFVKKEIPAEVIPVYQKIRQIDIPGIPKVYELIEQEDQAFVIEAYIHGSSLEKILEQNGALDGKAAAEIILTVCEILKKLHKQENPIIHRDIKPSNIMISAEGTVYVIDFDAARVYSEEKFKDTQLLGTKHYAPPEQYGLGQTDVRSDIYALGVMLNVMLTGTYPDKQMPEETMGNIINRCVKWDPKERYQTIEALQKALEKACQKEKNRIENGPEKSEHKTSGIPGFRSKVPWKMAVAVVGYLFVIYICLEMEITDQDGIPIVGAHLWLERIFALGMLFVIILYLGNFANLRERSIGRWKDQRLIRWIIEALCVAGIMILIVTCMVIIENFLWGSR